jgi:integrase
MTIDEARTLAGQAWRNVQAGRPPLEPPKTKPLFAAVAEEWMEKNVRGKQHRSARSKELMLEKHVLPAWGDKVFEDIGRSDIAQLLDAIQESRPHAPLKRQPEVVFRAIICPIMNWYARRSDDYRSPASGLNLFDDSKAFRHKQSRKRVLSDNELRALWQATEWQAPTRRTGDLNTYSGFIRLALLTGQRRETILSMKWDDLSLEDGVWTIPVVDARAKTHGIKLALPQMA